jgi:hypothetical protein
MCVHIINYKSTKFPIMQLVYHLCKTIDNMKQLNDNKWQIKGFKFNNFKLNNLNGCQHATMPQFYLHHIVHFTICNVCIYMQLQTYNLKIN